MAGRNKKGAIDIAFFDVSEMSGMTQTFYLIVCLSFLGFSLKWFYDVMVTGPEAAEASRKAAKDVLESAAKGDSAMKRAVDSLEKQLETVKNENENLKISLETKKMNARGEWSRIKCWSCRIK